MEIPKSDQENMTGIRLFPVVTRITLPLSFTLVKKQNRGLGIQGNGVLDIIGAFEGKTVLPMIKTLNKIPDHSGNHRSGFAPGIIIKWLVTVNPKRA